MLRVRVATSRTASPCGADRSVGRELSKGDYRAEQVEAALQGAFGVDRNSSTMGLISSSRGRCHRRLRRLGATGALCAVTARTSAIRPVLDRSH